MVRRNIKQIRKQRVRKALRERANGVLRLSVFKSNKHISVQIIDDNCSHTLVAASSLEADLQMDGKKNIEKASLVGETIAQRALAKGITQVVFDRGSNKYHGRVKAVAEGARAGGLKV